LTKINLLEAFLKGRSQTHERLYEGFQRWKGKKVGGNSRPREAQRADRSRIKAETIAAYGGVCLACDEKDPACLTIDHVRDDGAAERRKMGSGGGGTNLYRWLRRFGFPKDNYQLLCHNCQWRKRIYGPEFSGWPVYKT